MEFLSRPEVQNKKMPKLVNLLIFGLSCFALLALVTFIGWATKSALVTLLATLSAAYLCYVAAYWTILNKEKQP